TSVHSDSPKIAGKMRAPLRWKPPKAQCGAVCLVGLVFFARLLGEHFHQIHHPAAQAYALDRGEQRKKLRALRGGERVVNEILPRLGRARHPQRLYALEQTADMHIEGTANIRQPTRGYAIDALLVFLDLLEGYAK